MRVLITGICGFVGSTLAHEWIRAEPGLTVSGIDNLARAGSEINRRSLLAQGIEAVHGDIRCASDFEALPRVDWVVDAAANPSVLAGVDGRTTSRQLVEHNLLGTVNTLEYCKRYGAGFTLISTSRVYSMRVLADVAVEAREKAFRLSHGRPMPPGLSPEGVTEDFSTAPPLSLYGATKFASEVLALEYGETFGFPVFINRCGVLAGAGQFGRADQGIFSFWIHSWLRRRPLAYLGFGGQGYQVRDALHPRDLIPLLRKQCSSPSTATRTLNLGGGRSRAISLAQLSDWCEARFGPHDVNRDGSTRPFDIPWLVMDASRARETWDWQPQTSLEDLLAEIAHFAEENPRWLELSGAAS